MLPSLGRGWVDATAPHVLEPTLCAGREGYVDFGAFYDRAGIARVEPELRRRKRENAAQYPLVTACLGPPAGPGAGHVGGAALPP